MMESLPRVLITGATSGLGFAVAQELASSGRYSVVLGARNSDKADDVMRRLHEDTDYPVSGSAASAVEIDIADDTSIASAADSVRTRFGSLDILINSAGVIGGDPDVSLRDDMRNVFETNVFGAAVLMATFRPLLQASAYRDRRIVNVTSGAGQLGLALGSDERFNARGIPALTYRASKSALNMITAVHAMRFADDGIACVLAAPGPTRTRFSSGRGEKDVHEGARPIIRAAVEGHPGEMNGTLIADELTEYGW